LELRTLWLRNATLYLLSVINTCLFAFYTLSFFFFLPIHTVAPSWIGSFCGLTKQTFQSSTWNMLFTGSISAINVTKICKIRWSKTLLSRIKTTDPKTMNIYCIIRSINIALFYLSPHGELICVAGYLAIWFAFTRTVIHLGTVLTRPGVR